MESSRSSNYLSLFTKLKSISTGTCTIESPFISQLLAVLFSSLVLSSTLMDLKHCSTLQRSGMKKEVGKLKKSKIAEKLNRNLNRMRMICP